MRGSGAAYASGLLWNDAGELAREARGHIDAAVRRVTLRLGRSEQYDRLAVETVRAAIGAGHDLMVHASMRYHPGLARRMGRFLEAHRVFWTTRTRHRAGHWRRPEHAGHRALPECPTRYVFLKAPTPTWQAARSTNRRACRTRSWSRHPTGDRSGPATAVPPAPSAEAARPRRRSAPAAAAFAAAGGFDNRVAVVYISWLW